MIALGLGQGIIRPARDMMLRSAAPKGTTGTVFGYVSRASLQEARWRRFRSVISSIMVTRNGCST